MPQGTNINNFEQPRSERDLAPFYEGTEFYLHEANTELVSLEEARARREALGTAAFSVEQQKHRSELSIEGITRYTAWINYARRDYLDRHWNLDDEKAA